MPCNFLFKMEGDKDFEHMIIEGCQNSQASRAAIKFFMNRNPGVRVSNWDEKIESSQRYIIHLYQEGPAIFVEKMKVFLGPTKIIKDNSLPFGPDNFIEGMGFKVRIMESRMIGLAPHIQSAMDSLQEDPPV